MSAFNDGFNAGIKAAAEVVNSRRFGGEQDLRSIRASIEYLKPPAPAANDPWKSAVIDALVTAHIYTTAHESDPRGALKALLAYEQAV